MLSRRAGLLATAGLSCLSGCDRPPLLLPSCKKLEFKTCQRLMDSDLA